MKSTILLSIVIFVFATGFVSAEIVRGINIDFVTIGNPGNPGDTRAEANPYGCGAVDYEYRISKYEITNTQWNNLIAFAGAPSGNNVEGYNPYDESAVWTDAQQPTNEVSWYEATQFCNYLTSGDKSQGAYQFSGDNLNPGDFLGIDRDSAVSTYGIAYVLPTEDEWYKAAYYTSSGYSTYANGTEVAPIAGDDTNYNDVIGQPWDVGTGTMEQNGTFDMMGNIGEWMESPWGSGDYLSGSPRGLRGGAYTLSVDNYLRSSYRNDLDPYNEFGRIGFRVASVPEPCSLVLLGLGGLMLRRRR